MNGCDLNCTDSVSNALDRTRAELEGIDLGVWPDPVLVPAHVRTSYLQTLRVQERILTLRLSGLRWSG